MEYLMFINIDLTFLKDVESLFFSMDQTNDILFVTNDHEDDAYCV